MIRATIAEKRHRAATSGTLADLSDEIVTLRAALKPPVTIVWGH